MGSLRPPRRPLVLPLAALLVLATGCGRDDGTRPDVAATAVAPAAPPAPSPSPEAPVAPVAGERVPGAHWVDSTGLLTHQAPDIGPPDIVLPFVHAVGDWLDAHLDDLQRGGPGRLDEVAADGLLTAASDAELAAVTSSLASPDAAVAAAVYRLDASYGSTSEWLTATVEVVSEAGRRSAATLVFVPGDAGPELVLFGPAEPAGVAS